MKLLKTAVEHSGLIRGVSFLPNAWFRLAALIFCMLLAGAAYSSERSMIKSSYEGLDEAVVLLHGLARTEKSMKPMMRGLEDAGYTVVNVGYPSTEHPIKDLARIVAEDLERRSVWAAKKVSFVTHSMGGIVVRMMFSEEQPPNLGRVVMLCPPSKGSEIVDHMGDTWVFRKINGPAGRQLGTEEKSVPNSLGPPKFETGILAGDSSLNPLFSAWLKGPDDGKVSVERARLKGMKDFMVLPYGHTFFMGKKRVINQTIAFLRSGKFVRKK